MKNNLLKLIFGLIIFLFGLSLAYFTTSYLDKEQGFDYWLSLAIFSFVYIAIGMWVYTVFPVSLGFLFGADILLLHLLGSQYSDFPTIAKVVLLCAILALLYLFAWYRFKDMPDRYTAVINTQNAPVS